MSIAIVLMKHEYCSSCLNQSGNGISLENYVIRDDRTSYALQENDITLCVFCKRKAKQAEEFLCSIWNNQKLWNDNIYTTQELILQEQQRLPPSNNLSVTTPILIDINNDIQVNTKTKCTKNQIVSCLTNQQSPSKYPLNPVPLEGCSVKVEVATEEGEAHNTNDWNQLDDADDDSIQFDGAIADENDDNQKHMEAFRATGIQDSDAPEKTVPDPIFQPSCFRKIEKDSTQLDGAIADENDDNQKHMEAFSATMEKYEARMDSDAPEKIVPDPIFQPSCFRKIEKAKDNIELIRITRNEHMAERAKMAIDAKYIASPFKCENCFKGFFNKKAYENHMEKHLESNGKYLCDICFQRADTDEKMQAHTRSHLVRYKCTECGIIRLCRATIQDHYMSVHSQERQELHCPHCTMTFGRAVTRKTHIMYHHRGRVRVHCQYCPKTYAKQEGLLTHCINVHPNETEMVRRPYPCKHCDKAFSAPSDLKKHEIKHTNKKEFYCVECDKSFKSEANLKHHFKVATPHVNYMELPFPCLRCNKRFSVRRDLEFHMNGTHLKIKPYQCDLCERAYSSKCSLRKHIEVVHVGIPKPKYPCTMCGKEFDNIKNHMRTHTGERPFECSQCPMKFSVSSTLKTHIRLVHLKLTRKGLKRPEK